MNPNPNLDPRIAALLMRMRDYYRGVAGHVQPKWGEDWMTESNMMDYRLHCSVFAWAVEHMLAALDYPITSTVATACEYPSALGPQLFPGSTPIPSAPESPSRPAIKWHINPDLDLEGDYGI
jgi:hypothetical protein